MDRKQSKTDGSWISLVEYAVRKGVSLSTLRRHIKDRKLDYKIENGRYLLWDDGNVDVDQQDQDLNSGHDTVQKLSRELLQAHEEIAELKTLIALYEEKIPPHDLNN